MKTYKVEIREYLIRQIEIEANSKEEAYKIAKEEYGNGNIEIDWTDFSEASIEVIEEL